MKLKQKNNVKNKKIYEKPKLRIIELETDQVLILGCKLDSGGSAPGDPVTCIGNLCAEAGS
ncbi:MAG: hypothetical protein JSV88_20345 [Candidatus Aminicenantes bacterium]|nr:MAG: hypothetical protein JSV88_20345 [Candidatus Aminicenantes bacterium]